MGLPLRSDPALFAKVRWHWSVQTRTGLWVRSAPGESWGSGPRTPRSGRAAPARPVNFCRLGIGHRREVRTDETHRRTTMYAALTWLLAQAAARRGDDVVGDARRRRAALRRAPLEPFPTAAPLPFRAPGVLPVDAEPHTAAAAVGDLKQRLEALRTATSPPSDLRARLTALKAAKAEAPEAGENFW